MKPLGKEIDHYWMLTDMAAATQSGVVAAHQDGRLSQQDWSDMVQRCRACDWADGCRDWMTKVGQADVAPARCRNREVLSGLKAGK